MSEELLTCVCSKGGINFGVEIKETVYVVEIFLPVFIWHYQCLNILRSVVQNKCYIGVWFVHSNGVHS
jgi:hypothetical protein